MRSLACLVLACALGAGTARAQGPARDISIEEMRGERRVALVIGNSAYPSSPLKNPVNDARDVARVLRALGFDVLEHQNLTQRDMKLVVSEFGKRLRGSDVGLFFFAGHGIQVAGRNYLMPVDATPGSEDEADADTIDVASVLARMGTARNRLNIVILDACRDNPFTRSFRSSGQARGLAPIDRAPTGTLIAFATSPGMVARDGDGQNGLYTSELLKALPTPGLKLEDVFKRVRIAVRRATNGDQVPWESSSVEGEFMFALPGAAAAEGAGPRVAVVPPPAPPESPRFTVRKEIRQAVGSLSISSDVPGVEVWLAGQSLGTTEPNAALVVPNVPAGTLKITARKDGHQPWESDVQVAANQRSDVVIDITPLAPAPVITRDDGGEMVLVPAGEFSMGRDAAGDDDWPKHRVLLSAFYIDKHQVTNELYTRFRDATGRDPSRPFGYNSLNERRLHPVYGATWYQAEAYCKWAGKRLPTEAEWEHAARPADGGETAGTAGAALGGIRPIGSATWASAFGIRDVGNLLEWVADWYDSGYYRKSPERDPRGPATGEFKVLRGGNWAWFSQGSTIVRNRSLPEHKDLMGGGFRCAKDAR